ncbi:MAG: hypothetical protein WAL56_08990 [Candidatus Sulfotelmatobacter sp.]
MNPGPQILRSGREPNAEGCRQPYSAAADISIRVWTRAQLQANAPEVSWKSGSNLVFMISDVVTAAQGIPADDLRTGMSAHFNSAAQALKAAKSIERSILEFSRRRPEDCFGAAVIVHRPIELRPFLEGDPAPVSPAVSLLREAQPGQILVSQETYEHLRDLPGLQFRPLNGDGSTTGDNELLWTSAETYAHFATRLQEALASQPIRNDADASEFSSVRLSAMNVDDGEAGWMASHRLLVSLAACAVLVLAVLYALPTLRKSSPAVNSSTNSPAVTTPLPSAPVRLPNSSLPATESALPPAKVEPAPVPAPARKPAPKPVQSESKPNEPKVNELKVNELKVNEPKPVSDYDGFFAKDIPLLLKKAQSDAGAGDYENSRREYEIVLHLDPANPSARTGISRLNLSTDHK